MFTLSDFHKYQHKMVDFITHIRKCGLFVDMGLGKTVTSLTAAEYFLTECFVSKVLISAPLRVANTVWKQEAQNWEHLKHLKIEIVTGTEKERFAALKRKADIYVINVENIPWLVEKTKWCYEMLILDESSGYKSMKSKRFKALRKVLKHIDSLVLLTGTPSPNTYMDLWSQLFLIDSGQRLGKTITNYRNRFFKPSGYMSYNYKIVDGSEDKINELIKDICMTMSSEDYLELPDKVFVNHYIEMTPGLKIQHKALVKDSLLEIAQEKTIEVLSAAALTNKLLQFCNGAVYDAEKNTHHIHDLKIEALKELVELNPDENFFVAYNFKSDLERLKKAFPKGVVLSKSGDELKEWNKGNIKMLFVHPQSAGHGLNAQYGGNIIVWFGLTWSLEHYLQLNKRLHRQGQTKPVRIIHLILKGGMDERVLQALNNKESMQNYLLEYLKYAM